MKCKYCGGNCYLTGNAYKRNVRTLDGIKEIDLIKYRCEDCNKNDISDNEVAPKGSKLGWDVIEYIVIGCRKGSQESVRKQLLKEYDFKISVSSISTIVFKYGGAMG